MTTSSARTWVMWAGTIGYASEIDVRIEAALASGCTAVSLGPTDVARAVEEGSTAGALGQQCREAGLATIMDPLMNWDGGEPRPGSRFGRFSPAETLDMCEELQVSSISVIGSAGALGPIDDVAARFAAMCDRAATFGARVHLEFIPMTNIPDLATAWEIVRRADRPNGGLLLDTWHYYRGNPDHALLAAIPGDRIFAVQVDDAMAAHGDDLWAETKHREVPGDGELDLTTVLRILDASGGLTWLGPEVLSPALEAMPAVDAARLALDRTRSVLASALA